MKPNEKTYEFTVTLQGSGETQEDAWEDAIQAFSNDPGEPATVQAVED